MPDAARMLDLAIAVTLVEGMALAAWRAATGRGMPHRELVAFLGAGLALLVAVRLVTVRAPLVALGAALVAALVLHLWLVAQRWQR